MAGLHNLKSTSQFPPLPGVQLRIRISGPIFTDKFGINIIDPYLALEHILIGNIVNDYDPLQYTFNHKRLEGDRNDPNVIHGHLMTSPIKYKCGKHLFMIVDLSRTKKELMREFEENIKGYQEIFPKSRNRNKETTCNIWEVYDMKSSGVNFSEIARRISGIRGNPSNDRRLSDKGSSILQSH
ncbi:MAG: hypothetical protein AABZ11_00975 [Nitrospinota bacterium]